MTPDSTGFDRAALLRHLRRRFAIEWGGAHGGAHWARVLQNGLRLAPATGADVHVVALFAFFHDACRVNEYTDRDHGLRGAELALRLHGKLFEASAGQLDLLVAACTGHSDGHVDAPPTVQTCWDADRLDLGRVGIRPRAQYLCTAAARDPATLDWAYRRSRGGASRQA